jgi:penicillin-binding protein 2D
MNEQQIPKRQSRIHAAELKEPRWYTRIKKMFSFLFSILIIGAIASAVFFLYLRAKPLPAAMVPQTTQITDQHGQTIDSLYTGQNRDSVPLSRVSPYLIQATLAIEDHRFYNHFGIDLRGTSRAVWVNLQHMDKVQGASTLTQQLARNLYLSHDRTWERKIKEAYYTLQLETHWSKDQILEGYLNTVYFGHSTYGVQAAARMFFGKDAKDLTLAEAALMAGVPKGPAYYSPYLDEKNAFQRQKLILSAMVREGFISQQEADAAKQEKLSIAPLKKRAPAIAPYFSDYVKHHAARILNITPDELEEGGYQIMTTLDMNAQKMAEEAIERHIDKKSDIQAALVAIDPRNGYIKAMVGGRDYEKNQYNRVFADTRQPGSSFKAFVYLTALQKGGFTALTKRKSEPTVFTYDNGKKTYAPSNFGNHYPDDPIDLRQAIAQSDNIYAVQTLLDVGAEEVIATARKLGIQSPMQPVPSLALGTYPVSPFEMAQAFAVIANQGVKSEPVAILRIEDSVGRVLYEAQPQSEQVIEPEYTYVLTNLMESVFDSGGTAHRVAGTFKRPVAGKTGTTNNDAWLVGYTPELSTAVWIGYDRNRAISAVESYKAAPIFADFMENTLEAIPPKLFPIPDRVVSIYIDPATGKLADAGCPKSRLEVFIAGTEPTEYCTEHGSDKPAQQPPPKTDPKAGHSWWEDLKRWWSN